MDSPWKFAVIYTAILESFTDNGKPFHSVCLKYDIKLPSPLQVPEGNVGFVSLPLLEDIAHDGDHHQTKRAEQATHDLLRIGSLPRPVEGE